MQAAPDAMAWSMNWWPSTTVRDGDKEAQGLDLARVHRDVFDSHMGGASHLEDARVVKRRRAVSREAELNGGQFVSERGAWSDGLRFNRPDAVVVHTKSSIFEEVKGVTKAHATDVRHFGLLDVQWRELGFVSLVVT